MRVIDVNLLSFDEVLILSLIGGVGVYVTRDAD